MSVLATTLQRRTTCPDDQSDASLVHRKNAEAVPRQIIALGGRYLPYIQAKTEAYLLACQRYIELNPVRAAMVGNLNITLHQLSTQVPVWTPVSARHGTACVTALFATQCR